MIYICPYCGDVSNLPGVCINPECEACSDLSWQQISAVLLVALVFLFAFVWWLS